MPRQRSNVKPQGRKTAYASFVQFFRKEQKNKQVGFLEFSKRCAERWRTMSDREKKRFHDMAARDKRRYETEIKNYTPCSQKIRMKDSNAPKRPIPAFFQFSKVERRRVKEMNPEYTAVEISKELGRLWAEADASVKRKYQELADQDKARYEREMSRYKERSAR
uniref:High mobility group protein DSP1 n=1 Tax=Lygus hesperus TaxID=30085 RepID=A0A0A9WCV9_LYGHE